MIANLNHERVSSCSEQPGLKSGETVSRQTRGRRMYQDLPGNHWATYVTRVRRCNGLWRPRSYSLATQTRIVFSTPLNSDTPGPPEESESILLKWRRYTCMQRVFVQAFAFISSSFMTFWKKPCILDHGREAMIPESSFFFLELGSWVISSAQSFPNCYMCPTYSPLLAYTHTHMHEHTYMHMLLYILLYSYLHNENNTNILYALYTHIHISTWICVC